MSGPWERYASAEPDGPWVRYAARTPAPLRADPIDEQQTTQNADIASQAGLALRSGAKAIATLPAMLADAVTGPLNWAQDKLLGPGQGYRFQAQLPALDRALTAAGLPAPDTPTQRIVGKAVELGAGAGAAARAADLLGRGSSGVAQQVLQRLADNPTAQVMGGAGAGAAGQHSEENGGNWGSQLASSLLGGVAGAGFASMAQSGAQRLAQALAPQQRMQDIERRISVALEGRGIDPASITPALKSALMADAQAALKIGGSLDDAALARLVDYRRLGLTPTQGRITLDPLAVTREQNAMKLAAATGNADARLPQIAQANNRGLLNAIEAMGPQGDTYLAGSAAMRPILAKDAAMQAAESALYAKARAMPGGTAPLSPGPFTQSVWKALDDDLKTPFLPEGVAKVLNKISTGEMPFDVRTIDVLKTTLSTAQRASGDGNVRRALGIVRDQLESYPLAVDKPLVGGAQVVNGATAQAMQQADAAPAGLLAALNEARGAAFQRRQWQESAPGIARALDGATPDTFVAQNIVSKGVGFGDVSKMASVINTDPAAREAVRGSILQHLQDAAIGRGNAAETGAMSGRQWMRALSDIGERKLGLFFDAGEVEQLKAIGRVGTYEVFQPRGSAVNNSNTAAAAGHMVAKLASAIPGVGPLAIDPLKGGANRMSLAWNERQAQDIPRGLLSAIQDREKAGLLEHLMLPMVVSGGLFSP